MLYPAVSVEMQAGAACQMSITHPSYLRACLLPGSVLFLNVGQRFMSLCHCLFVYSKQLQARGLGFALKWHSVVDLLRSSFAQ